MYVCTIQELDQRYNALLQMYGEKVEEAEELRLDLMDVKDMYKSQVLLDFPCRIAYTGKQTNAPFMASQDNAGRLVPERINFSGF